MASKFFLASMASKTKNKKVMQIISEQHPAVHNNLALNKELPSEIWVKLFNKAKIDLASNLVRNRDFSLVELELVLKDKRVGVRTQLFSKGFNPDYIDSAKFILKQDWFNNEYARLWVRSGTVPATLLKKVIARGSENFIIEQLSNKELYSIKDCATILEKLNLNNSLEPLAKLLELRPEIIEKIIPISHRSLHGALAGSRHIFNQNLWVELIKVIKLDLNSSYGKDAIWVMLANPNLDIANLTTVVEIAEGIPKNVYASKFLTVDQSSLLRQRNSELRNKAIRQVTSDWEKTTSVFELAIVELALKALSPARYPILTRILHVNKYGENVVVKNTAKPVDESEPDLSFIPNKTRVFYNEKIEKIISQSITTKAQWETLLSLLGEWENSLGTLVSTTVELSKK